MEKDSFYDKYKKDSDALSEWCDELVNQCLGDTLRHINDIHTKINTDQITMTEMEWILMDLPIQLIYISERLSKLQLFLEATKLSKAHDELEYTKELKNGDVKYTATEVKQLVADAHRDDAVGITVYESAISIIEKYIALSREIIMGVKKVWTRRLDAESGTPVIPPADLPDYAG